MSKKTLSLTFDLSVDFELIGICSSLEHHQLCYFINKYLNSELGRLDEDIDLTMKDKSQINFPSYADDKPEINHIWYLIQNKIIVEQKHNLPKKEVENLLFDIQETHKQTYYLIPDRQDIDYFLQVHPPILEKDIIEIKRKINNIIGVKSVFSIDPNSTKKIDNLLIR